MFVGNLRYITVTYVTKVTYVTDFVIDYFLDNKRKFILYFTNL